MREVTNHPTARETPVETSQDRRSTVRRSLAILIAAAFLVVGGVSTGCGSSDDEGCGSDDDCKGERICEDGDCTDPGDGSGDETGGSSGGSSGGDTGGTTGGETGGSSSGSSDGSGKSIGEACEVDGACKTDLCHKPGINPDGYCSKTCTDSFDCPNFWECKNDGGTKICVNE